MFYQLHVVNLILFCKLTHLHISLFSAFFDLLLLQQEVSVEEAMGETLRDISLTGIRTMIERENLLFLGDGSEKNPYLPEPFDAR